MSILPKVSEYQDQMGTDAATKVGMYELEKRKALNSVIDILNAAWLDWTPTLAWTGTGPLGATAVAKYIQMGSTVLFKYQIVSTVSSGSASSGLTISLPVTPKDDDTIPPIKGLQLVAGATYTNSQPYIDMTTSTAAERLIRFRNYTATIPGTAVAHYVQGIYQVA